MRRSWLGLAAGVGLLLTAGSNATTLKRLSLTEVVAYSSEVFVGTVTRTRVVEGGSPRNLLYTEVTFGQLDVLKGRAPGPTMTYRFAGGTLGDRTVRVVGVPVFEVGRRSVVFANAKLDGLCPAVGWWQGRYLIAKDAETKGEILLDSAGRPVYAFASGQPIVVRPDEMARPISLASFRAMVREVIRIQADPKPREPDEPDTPDGPDGSDAEGER